MNESGFVGWLIVLVGIWHPYVFDVSPKIAAVIASMLGLIGGIVAMI